MKTSNILILAACMIFQSCITIKRSSLELPEAEKIDIANCEISSTGAVYMNIFGIIRTDFIPNSIKIESNGVVLYADPLVTLDTVKADYIFITHNHLDHFSKSDIKKLSKSGTIIVGPKTIAGKVRDSRVKVASIGDTLDFGRIKCEVVESYNLNSKIHKKGSNYVGYIISCDTIRIYIAGDTDFIPEMKDLKNITVAIIPIGEGKTAMNPQSAAEAVNRIQPGMAVPVHYELGQGREKQFTESVDEQIEVKFFQKQ